MSKQTTFWSICYETRHFMKFLFAITFWNTSAILTSIIQPFPPFVKCKFGMKFYHLISWTWEHFSIPPWIKFTWRKNSHEKWELSEILHGGGGGCGRGERRRRGWIFSKEQVRGLSPTSAMQRCLLSEPWACLWPSFPPSSWLSSHDFVLQTFQGETVSHFHFQTSEAVTCWKKVN